jgi:hypothetical protein
VREIMLNKGGSKKRRPTKNQDERNKRRGGQAGENEE